MISAPSSGVTRAAGHVRLAADQLAGLLEHQRRAGIDQAVEGAADGRVGGDAGEPVRAAAFRGDDRSESSTGSVGAAAASASRASIHARPAAIVAAVPPSCWMTSSSAGRPLARIASSSAVRRNSSQPSETSSTECGVRMRAYRLQDPVRVGARIAAGKADQLRAMLLEGLGDAARDVVRAFDEIGDEHIVADAEAAVGAAKPAHRAKARPAGHGGG